MRRVPSYLLVLVAAASSIASASGAGRVEGRIILRGDAPEIPTVLLDPEPGRRSTYVWTKVRQGRFTFRDVRPGTYRAYVGLVSLRTPISCDPLDVQYRVEGRSYSEAPLLHVRAGETLRVTMVVSRPACPDVTVARLRVDRVPVIPAVRGDAPWTRSIVVTVANIGDLMSGPIDLVISQVREDGAWFPTPQEILARDRLPRLRAGGRVTKTYPWDATVTVGRVRLIAQIGTRPETRLSNNHDTTTESFVVPD